MATVTAGDFEWHDTKALRNEAEHDVTFEEAAVALMDPHALDLDDLADPTRIVTLGRNPLTGILYVVWTEGSAHRTRIINARKALAHEQRQYEED